MYILEKLTHFADYNKVYGLVHCFRRFRQNDHQFNGYVRLDQLRSTNDALLCEQNE